MQGILERYGILDAVTDPNCTLMDGTAIQLNIGDLNTEHGEVMPTDSSAMQGILERYGILDAVTDPNCTLMDGTAIQLNIGDLNQIR